MTTNLANYALRELSNDGAFSLYRGTAKDSQSILLLTPVSNSPARATLAQLDHTFSLRDDVEGSWAARPVELVHHGGRRWLVLEDPGVDPLQQLAGQRMELETFLCVAIGAVTALGQLHERGFIHNDIKPANLLVDPTTGRTWLSGIGLTSRRPHQRHVQEPLEVIAGTLAYMAPERTGRINRSVDLRSDLYAFGITLYELLTGSLPFRASTASEWVHCHIAHQPIPPKSLIDELPEVISDLVMKLIAKAAEDRYQTAKGIATDLERCLHDWQQRGRIDQFPLASSDCSDQLRIPESLYGREKEIDQLLTTFDRVVREGTTELVLVAGYSGIGKSSVVNELHKALAPSRGLFASGKCDQYKRDIPYATLAQAFQQLIRQILTQSDRDVARWRDDLVEALGPNGQLVVNLIPEIEHIIGKQPPVPDIPPEDTKVRFQRTLRRFISVFARPEHPLALFLDDLQWLDATTLELLEHLLATPEVRHLMLVGAYRNNEVSATHPLSRTLSRLREFGGRLHEIALGPLDLDDVEHLVADALRVERASAGPLARLLHDRSGGNPFFSIQFFTTLEDEGMLVFQRDGCAWTWDLDRIRARHCTDNVVDLMHVRLARLPSRTQETLQSLACLGNTTEVSTLAIACNQTEAALDEVLAEALDAGLVLRQESVIAFLHDRVQEAAYELIPADQRPLMHLRIGRMLAARTHHEQLPEKIFEIVNQLNRGAALIDSQEEKESLARFNLIAGRRAKAATAYAAALAYFAVGRALLADVGDDTYGALLVQLEFHSADCEFLTGDLGLAEERLADLSRRVQTLADRASVACLQVTLYTALDRSDRAIGVCFDYLRSVGIEWSAHPTDEDLRQEYQAVCQRIGERAIEDLVDLPLITDPERRATIDVLTAVQPAALYMDKNLNGLIVCRMVNLSLEHGHCDASCYAYVIFGMILGPQFGAYGDGVRFGKLAHDLVETRGLEQFKARVFMCFGNIVNPWKRHARTGRPLVQRAFEVAQESGDLTFAVYSCHNLVTNLLVCGDHLDGVQQAADSGFEFVRNARFSLAVYFITGQLRLIMSLRGLLPHFGSLEDEEFSESEFEQRLTSNPSLSMATCWYWIRKLQARFFARDFAAALVAAEKAGQLTWTSPSFLEVCEYHFYAALSLAAHYDDAAEESRPRLIRALRVHYTQLEVQADNCADNFANRALLVSAELARLEGRDLDAMRLYERSIRSSQEQGFIHNEAIASEVAARFYDARDLGTAATAHRRNARSCYEAWGAVGKVRDLDQQYPELHRQSAGSIPAIETTVGQLDFATVAKMSQAVSGEIVLGRLIERVMSITLEHAGARRGLLLLPVDGDWRVEAEATTGHGAVSVSVPSTSAGRTLPEVVLRYVVRTRASVILDDATKTNAFSDDPYVQNSGVRSMLCLPLIQQQRLVAVLYLENDLTSHVFTPTRIAVLQSLASQAAISLENAQLYDELRRSDAHLAEAQRVSHTGSFGWSVSTGRLVWSAENYRIFDVEPTVTPTIDLVLSRTHPADVDRLAKLLERAAEDGKDWEVEHRLCMPDHSVKHVHVRARALTSGAPRAEFIGAVVDVTEAKHAEQQLQASLEEKESLLKEVHHRVKNNLQLVSSLLGLQAERAAMPQVAELLRESRTRIRSMALVHENLYRAGNFASIAMDSHIRSLCSQLSRIYDTKDRSITLTVDVEDLHLDIDRAVSCGLIVNELVSNALKHAFAERLDGGIRVGLHRREEGIVLVVSDDGVGFTAGASPAGDSLGLQIVRDLADQLHGTLSVESGPGVTFTVTFKSREGSGAP